MLHDTMLGRIYRRWRKRGVSKAGSTGTKPLKSGLDRGRALRQKAESLAKEVARLNTALSEYQSVLAEFGGLNQGVEVDGPEYFRLCLNASPNAQLIQAASLVLEDAVEWCSPTDSHFQTSVESIEDLRDAMSLIVRITKDCEHSWILTSWVFTPTRYVCTLCGVAEDEV